MRLRLATGPELEPVSLGEAKAHLRLEVNDDDAYVTTLIHAARQYAEEYLWRGIVTQTWEAILERFPCAGEIELPRGNLVSITYITYVDPAGDAQTLSTDVYEADTAGVPGRVVMKYGQTWPSTRCQWNAVVIRYQVGWSVEDVPVPIKQAILLLVSQMYEHRTPEVLGASVSPVRFAAEALLAPYRLVRI